MNGPEDICGAGLWSIPTKRLEPPLNLPLKLLFLLVLLIGALDVVASAAFVISRVAQ